MRRAFPGYLYLRRADILAYFIELLSGVGKDTPQEKQAASVLGFRPKNVTNEMVRAFPLTRRIYSRIE